MKFLQCVFSWSKCGFVLLVAILSSCSLNHPCIDTHIHPVFIGFQRADIDSLILRAYRPNDNYQHLVDTVLVVDKFTSIYSDSHDSTVVFVNDSNPYHWIYPGLDWELVIPAKSRTIRISNIRTMQIEGKGRACYNPVTSAMIDGQRLEPPLVVTDKFYTSGYQLYFHN